MSATIDLNRRSFIAAAGAALATARMGWASSSTPRPSDQVNVAMIGVGAQGRVLIEACLRIPGVRFQSICDIWEYSRKYGEGYLRKFGHRVTGYENYREMLDKEKGLDAVIVATPDWMHAEHANACMEAGYNVYCEKEMSNSIEKAQTMVLTRRKTGKLLQIGHQRRSNPRYIHAIDTLIRKVKLLGRVTQCYAQWNRSVAEDLGWPKRYTMEPAKLAQYGYGSMTELLNWRWYRKYGGGPIVDLGSHQIDLFSWVYGVNPKSVIAGGGADYYKTHEWYDNVMAIYEYDNEEGAGRSLYQVLTTTKHGGFYETFMGVDGSIVISEVPDRGNAAEREAHAPDWEPYVRQGLLKAVIEPIRPVTTRDVLVDVRVTQEAGKWPLPIELAKPAHQPHLENFFDAIRRGTPLNCPAEVGYETAVAVLRANNAVDAARKLEFKPEEFHV